MKMFPNDAMILVLHFLATFQGKLLIINQRFVPPSERQHERFILTGCSRAGNCAEILCLWNKTGKA